MPLLDKLERRFSRFTFPYLLQCLIFGQVLVFIAIQAQLVFPLQLVMNAPAVMAGEFWRMFTFMVVPLNMNFFWFLLGAYVTYLIGGSLEREWGEFRFGLYVGLGWLATVLISWIVPAAPITNGFIMGSLTLAFARLYPDVEFRIMLLFPVKVKYIGYFTWGIYALALFTQPLFIKLQVLAGVLPFFVFFGKELVFMIKDRKRVHDFKQKTKVDPSEAFHVCSVCGATDKTDPDRAYRYKGTTCFCEECLKQEGAA